jgi:hypothetical protein
MKFSKKSVLVIAAIATAMSSAAFASGSEGFSSAQNNDTRLYNAGKGVYADKFSCSTCPLAGKSLNASVAKEVLGGTPKVQLSTDEQDAVMVYLKRRFKI